MPPKEKWPRVVAINATRDEQKGVMLPYSNSRLVAINMCPTWGVVSAKRRYDTEARAMALEAGELMHKVFGAVRIWQLEHVQGLREHALFAGERLFGKKRWKQCVKEADSKDQREQLMQLAFAVLHSSDWVDEPRDTNRTLTNMEMASIHYIDERLPYMEEWPIYVESKKKPDCLVGIEQVFDVVVLYSDGRQIRYIGTIDGLVEKARMREYFLDENKTAMRIDEGWKLSFDMSNQITGYCAACTVVFGFKVFRSRVTGVGIKPTGRGDYCVPLEPVERTEEAFQAWGRWLRHTVDIHVLYREDYENAPRYTHSCNRYFRPCALLSFCADSVEGRLEQYAQMVPADPSPSERGIQETM